MSVAAQALAVIVFAELELIGMRRSRPVRYRAAGESHA